MSTEYSTSQFVIETNESKPERVAVIAAGRIVVSDGYRVRMASEQEDEDVLFRDSLIGKVRKK